MLLLRAKATPDRQHGNGIMYGGGTKIYNTIGDFVQKEVFYVETDFGNHMTLTWGELNEMFEVVGVRDYGNWRMDRSQLQSQPNLIESQSYEQLATHTGRS